MGQPFGPKPHGLAWPSREGGPCAGAGVRAPGELAVQSPCQICVRDGAVARTWAARLCFAGDKVMLVSTGGAPGRRRTWSLGTELTEKGSSMVRWRRRSNDGEASVACGEVPAVL
jgi:hypothetical protein